MPHTHSRLAKQPKSSCVSRRLASRASCATAITLALSANASTSLADEPTGTLEWRAGLGAGYSSEDCSDRCPVERNPWAWLEAYVGVDRTSKADFGLELFGLPLWRRPQRVQIRHLAATVALGTSVSPRLSLAGAVGFAHLHVTSEQRPPYYEYTRKGLDLGPRARYRLLSWHSLELDLQLRGDLIVTGDGPIWVGGLAVLLGN